MKLFLVALLASLFALSAVRAAPPAPRKMRCVCCSLEQGRRLDGTYGYYCGYPGGPSMVEFYATPNNYKEIGEKACRKNLVDQDKKIYVTSCSYVD